MDHSQRHYEKEKKGIDERIIMSAADIFTHYFSFVRNEVILAALCQFWNQDDKKNYSKPLACPNYYSPLIIIVVLVTVANH